MVRLRPYQPRRRNLLRSVSDRFVFELVRPPSLTMSNQAIVKMLRGEVTYPSPADGGKNATPPNGYSSGNSTYRQTSTSSSLATTTASHASLLIPSTGMRTMRANVGLPTMPRPDSYYRKKTFIGEFKRLKSVITVCTRNWFKLVAQ